MTPAEPLTLAHTTQCKSRKLEREPKGGERWQQPLPGSPLPSLVSCSASRLLGLGSGTGFPAAVAPATAGSQTCFSLLTRVWRLPGPPLFLQLSESSWGSRQPCGYPGDLPAPSSGTGGWTGQISYPWRGSWSPWASLAPVSSGPGCCSNGYTGERPQIAPAGRGSSFPSAPGTCQHSHPQPLLCTRRCSAVAGSQGRSPAMLTTVALCHMSGGAGDSRDHPAPAAQGHSPFQVGSNPHVGHLPAHSCNEREDNQSLPREGWALALRAGHCPASWAPWHVGKEAGGQGWAFPPPFTGQRVVRGHRSLMGNPFTFHVCHEDVSICPLVDPMLEGAAFEHDLRGASCHQAAISLSDTVLLAEPTQVLLHRGIRDVVGWSVNQVQRNYPAWEHTDWVRASWQALPPQQVDLHTAVCNPGFCLPPCPISLLFEGGRRARCPLGCP